MTHPLHLLTLPLRAPAHFPVCLTPQLERARRLAAQYAAAALQSRPKLKLHLELDAPKVGERRLPDVWSAACFSARWPAMAALAALRLHWLRGPSVDALPPCPRWPSRLRMPRGVPRWRSTLVASSSRRVGASLGLLVCSFGRWNPCCGTCDVQDTMQLQPGCTPGSGRHFHTSRLLCIWKPCRS